MQSSWLDVTWTDGTVLTGTRISAKSRGHVKLSLYYLVCVIQSSRLLTIGAADINFPFTQPLLSFSFFSSSVGESLPKAKKTIKALPHHPV
jgi:hypothetical protein